MLHEWFRRFSNVIAQKAGSATTFAVAFFLIVVWGFTGPYFHYSNTWQLVINTTTTIITFLMVFLIQNTQNRDTKAIHIKLDELIRGMKSARNQLINVEEDSDLELDQLKDEFKKLQEQQLQKNQTADRNN